MLWKALRSQRLDLERGSARFSIIQRMTVLEVLESTTAYFKKREIDSPRLNAEHLLAQVLGCKRIDVYLKFERELDEAELALLRERVRRRGQGEPLSICSARWNFVATRSYAISARSFRDLKRSNWSSC